MNRFGKIVVALLLLAVIALAVMIRFVDAPSEPPATTSAGPMPSGLVIPVVGVQPAQLVDNFGDAREGHVHRALDIMAPRGTPVVAAAPGTIEKLFDSEAGGHTIYVRATDPTWVYYYAHLDAYAEGLAEGARVTQGQAIATVGSTGNADPAGPHLHFEIKRMAAGEKWWHGAPIDPYPLLAGKPAAR